MKLFKIETYNRNKSPIGECYVVAKNITEAKRALKKEQPYVKSFGRYRIEYCTFAVTQK